MNVNSAPAGLRLRGVGSLTLHGLRVLLQVVSAVLLARLLLPEGLGRYSFVMAIVAVAIIPAQLGLAPLLIRETAAAAATGDFRTLGAVWLWSGKIALLSTVVVVAVLGVSGALMLSGTSSFVPELFFLGLVIVPFSVAINLGEAAMQGVGKTATAMIAGHVFKPAILVLSLLAVLALGWTLSPSVALILQLLSFALAMLATAWLITREVRSRFQAGVGQRVDSVWFRAAITFLFGHVMWVVLGQADLLLLGTISTPYEVGLYRVASTGAGLTFLALNAFVPMISERISALHQSGSRQQLQDLLGKAALAALALATPLLVLFLVAGPWVIGVLFGAEYRHAASALAILCMGQAVHVSCGYASAMLGMAGNERTLAMVLAPTACLNIVLNLILIPPLGAQGAAIATSISIAGQALAMWLVVRRRFGIDTGAWRGVAAFVRGRVQ